MSSTHDKVIQCIGLLSSAIRKLSTACLFDRISPITLAAALDDIYNGLQILLTNASSSH